MRYVCDQDVTLSQGLSERLPGIGLASIALVTSLAGEAATFQTLLTM